MLAGLAPGTVIRPSPYTNTDMPHATVGPRVKPFPAARGPAARFRPLPTLRPGDMTPPSVALDA
jgi:hypothetical protein